MKRAKDVEKDLVSKVSLKSRAFASHILNTPV